MKLLKLPETFCAFKTGQTLLCNVALVAKAHAAVAVSCFFFVRFMFVQSF